MPDLQDCVVENVEIEKHEKNLIQKKKIGKKLKTKKEKNHKLEKQDEPKDKKDDKESLLLQDHSFTVEIQPPSGPSFEIQVSSMELVQEIHQVLMDREDTCHRTCFSLMLGNITLDNFSELKTIEELKEGSLIRVVEQPYTMREARIHIRHIRDLLKSLDCTDAYNGSECASLSFLNTVTQGDILDKKLNLESLDCTPPEYIIPSCEENIPLMPLQPFARDLKLPKCLKILNISGWNPPPGTRKMHGDLLYLYIVTLESKRFHVTASTWGFFVNESTEEEFNPKPINPCYLYHSLIDLLNHISASFKRNFSSLQKKRTSLHPFERVPTPYQIHSWVSPNLEHNVDSLRAEDAFSSKLGYEEHIPGQTRDWNEELQTTRELPRTNLPERLLRERAIFKVHSDFVAAAMRGAVAVVDGNVMAINPGEDPKMQMFIWNNIFFSLGFDVRDHYIEVGGDAAAFVAPRNDLQGVKVYSSVDLEGLFTLGTVVVDYRGFRVTAQSIIPGILEREQEHSVVYGSIDFGKTVVTHPKYIDLLRKAGQQLKILPHKVVNDKDEEIELCSSIECKGIIGNDGRHYILDLLRTFPPDVNFLPSKDIEISESCKQMNFPKAHKHKLATLRQELVDAFVENRYMLFLKHAALTLQTMTVDNQREVNKIEARDNKDTEVDGTMMTLTENINGEKKNHAEEVVKIASEAIGSLKPSDFDVRFNPDVFSPGVKHANPDSEKLMKERQLVVDAADFLVNFQIPGLMRDFIDHSSTPSDGTTLCESLHNRGINIRYLGKVTNLFAKVPELKYLHSVAAMELISRSIKHIFIEYSQSIETIFLSSGVAHFLNCFLSSCPNPHPPVKNDEVSAKKKKRRSMFSHTTAEWTSLTPKSLWAQVRNDLKSYFDWTLKGEGVDSIIDKFGIQKISLLRSFCLKCGVQVLLKDYNFNSRTAETFHDDNVLNLFPIVKHINPRASDAFNLYTAGQSKINQGIMKEGYELISEALNLLNNVYGAMHPEIAQCLRMLARINYIMGEYMEAMSYQQKAVLMSERVNGIDSPHTITEYIHLALYCFANQQVSISLKLLYRARYLILVIHGPVHPELSLIDSNIGLILHAVSQYTLSLQFLKKALDLNILFYGSKSLKVGLSYHLVARAFSCNNDFRSALRHEREAYAIYKDYFGTEHEKTKECDACLKHLTAQAVSMAKKINEINGSKTKSINISPVQTNSPSMISVLENLNAVNGILYIQITQAELDQVREELEKGHLKMLESEKVKQLTNDSNKVKNEDLEKTVKINGEKTEEKVLKNITNVEERKFDKSEDDDDAASR